VSVLGEVYVSDSEQIAYRSSIAKVHGYVSGELKEQMQVISVSTGAYGVWIQNPETTAF
jgi:hypothetical protein